MRIIRLGISRGLIERRNLSLVVLYSELSQECICKGMFVSAGTFGERMYSVGLKVPSQRRRCVTGKTPELEVRAISFRCVVRNPSTERMKNVGLGRCVSPALLVMRPAHSQQKSVP